MANQGFGLRINNARCDKRLSQGELAASMRVGQPSVSKWEREAACPSRLVFDKLARLLGVTAEWLLWGGNPPEPKRALHRFYDPDMSTVKESSPENAVRAAHRKRR